MIRASEKGKNESKIRFAKKKRGLGQKKIDTLIKLRQRWMRVYTYGN